LRRIQQTSPFIPSTKPIDPNLKMLFVWMSFERRRAEFDDNNADFGETVKIIQQL